MYISHQAMRDEIDRLKKFAHARENNSHLYQFARALEDLPEDARQQALMIMDVPDSDSFRKKVIDVATDAACDLYGSLERVKFLHFLSQYPVTPYTYVIDSSASRGSRPSIAKLTALAAEGYTATVNLCAEMPGGDLPQIEQAGLTASLKTYPIPITDMTPPQPDQVTGLLRLLTTPETGRTYLHCEAGKARTGVMTACYRMAVMGWSPEAALLEAKNFGCSVPDQLDFIQDFGERLAKGDLKAIGYPLRPLGSHTLTRMERNATIATAVAAGTDGSRPGHDGKRG